MSTILGTFSCTWGAGAPVCGGDYEDTILLTVDDCRVFEWPDSTEQEEIQVQVGAVSSAEAVTMTLEMGDEGNA